MNRFGLSNDILVPLADGKVLSETKEITRSDQEAMILYFLMVDRFKNGNKQNDEPVKDDEIDHKVNYMGGDLDGINQAIKDGYFAKLGVNTSGSLLLLKTPYRAIKNTRTTSEIQRIPWVLAHHPHHG